jgi:ribosomal protein L35
VVVNKRTAKILAVNFANGKRHDFRLFKESRIRTAPKTKVLADTGYLGIQKIISNSRIPHKRSKKHPLTKEQKQQNREISSQRVLCENVIGSVKRFRILSERYRNRRKRFGLRFSLIAGIHNYELG